MWTRIGFLNLTVYRSQVQPPSGSYRVAAESKCRVRSPLHVFCFPDGTVRCVGDPTGLAFYCTHGKLSETRDRHCERLENPDETSGVGTSACCPARLSVAPTITNATAPPV